MHHFQAAGWPPDNVPAMSGRIDVGMKLPGRALDEVMRLKQ
jgi:hypothetical protein